MATTMSRSGVERYVAQAKEALARRAAHRARVRRLKFDTIAVHGMYSVEEAFSGGQGGIIEPIFPSTSQAYRDSDEMEAALSYQIPTWCYSRIHNPTVFYLEETLALLESYGCDGDATGLCTSSGMAAIKQATEPLLAKREQGAEDINFVSASQVYGGTFQLFNLRMAERGAQVRWVTEPWRIEAWEPLVDDSTRFLYAEMPSNPQQACFDVGGGRRARARPRHSADRRRDHRHAGADAAARARRRHRRPLAVQDRRRRRRRHRRRRSSPATTSSRGTSPDEVTADYALWLKLWPFRDSGPCMAPQHRATTCSTRSARCASRSRRCPATR